MFIMAAYPAFVWWNLTPNPQKLTLRVWMLQYVGDL